MRAPSGEKRLHRLALSWPRRTNSSVPLAASHTRTVLSSGPADDARAIRRERGTRQKSRRGRAGPEARPRSPRPTPAPCRQQTPLTMRAPSGENPAAVTRSSWPRRTRSSSPLAASHTRTVSSSDPLTMRAPSGENAAAETPLMAAQDQQLLAARRVPHPHRLVVGPAHDARAIGRERRCRDPVLVATQTSSAARSPRPRPAACRPRPARDAQRHRARTRLPDTLPSWPLRTFSSRCAPIASTSAPAVSPTQGRAPPPGSSGRPASASCMAVTGRPSELLSGLLGTVEGVAELAPLRFVRALSVGSPLRPEATA